MSIVIWILIGLVVIFILSGIRIVRPVEKMLVETLGKYVATKEQGFSWIIPIIQRVRKVNTTEQMVDIQPQTVITKDNLNAIIDAVIYYQIKDVKASQYNVDNHEIQLTSLARTTLRAVVGQMTFADANEKRDEINLKVETILDKETTSYGVEVLRVEIQKIEAPQDVQESMNEVVIAERKKISAENFANALETEADGKKRAYIKEAEGLKQSTILKAEGDKEASILRADGESKAFDLINKSFKDNAQLLEKLRVTERALKNNTKIVLPSNGEIINVIGDLSGVLPIKENKNYEKIN